MAHNQVGPNLKAFLEETMRRDGVSLLAAATYPGAKKAEALDNKEHAATIAVRTTDEFLGPRKGVGFKSAEERIAAFGARDKEGRKLYDINPAYREAVVEMARYTSEEIMGLHRPLANVPTNADMLRAAEEDLYKARRDELFHKSASKDPVEAAQARYDLVAFHQNPANQAIMERFERTEQETRPLEYELKQAQARGERVGTSLQPTEEQIQNIEEHPYDAFAGDAKPQVSDEWK